MKVRIIEPVEFDGKPLEVGKVADLPKDTALALIGCKAAVDPVAEAAAAAEREKANKASADRMAADAAAADAAQRAEAEKAAAEKAAGSGA